MERGSARGTVGPLATNHGGDYVNDEIKEMWQDVYDRLESDDLAVADVSAAFDASGLVAPGNVLGVDVKKAAEGTGGDDPIMLCCSVVIECV